MKRTICGLLALSVIFFLSLALSGCGGTSRAANPGPGSGNGNGNGNGSGSGGSATTFQLQVTANGTGSVTSSPAGINCGNGNTSCSATFNAGTVVTLAAAPATGFSLSAWGGDCSGAGTCSVTMNANHSVTATFTAAMANPQLQVSVTGTGTVTSSPAGISCGEGNTACSANFNTGASVTLTAAAPEDGTWVFTGWSGDCSDSSACTLTMDKAHTVTATFAQQPLLQVTVTGTGSVTSNPAGIECGGGASKCSAPFVTGSSVTLTATPANGFAFDSWNGCASTSGTGCTVAMNGNQSVTVNFKATQPQVTVTLAGTGSGAVTSNPAGIDCGATCTASFAGGTTVTLTATPAQGSTFDGWSGACSGANCSLNLGSANAAVTATFSAGNTTGIEKVNHILFLLNENRGFDHYFGHLNDYRVAQGLGADVDGTPTTASNPCHGATGSTTANCGWDGTSTIAANAEGTTNTLSPFHLKTMCVENPSPSWNESHVDWNINYTSDTPLLNGYVMEAAGDAIVEKYHDVYGRRAMGYYNASDLPYYYFMATQFATADNWFSPVMSRTHPNRMYLIAATSQGHAYPIGSGGGQLNKQLTAKTIFGELQSAGVSWKIYGGSYTYYQMFTESSQLLSGHLFNEAQYDADLQSGVTCPANFSPGTACLPQVAMIEANLEPGTDEHPGTDPNSPGPNVQYGANFVETHVIGKLMSSSFWKDSVFIFSYDEGGGFYDHVAPIDEPNPDGIAPGDLATNDICTGTKTNTVNCNFNRSGFRVPMFVVSPFVKPHYVSHTPMDYTAILKFIETRFGLPSLTARDAHQPDMTEFFDFANAPWATPPTPPQQPVNWGPNFCYYTQFP